MAVARRVASELSVPIGGESVGFRVGGERKSRNDTKLVFATAGVQLEDIRSNGVSALMPYRVIVVDEVHFRVLEHLP